MDPRRMARDDDLDVMRELLLAARAERRLREFELTRRRVLLVLTVVCALTAIVVGLAGHEFPALTAGGIGLASGLVGALARGGERG